MSKKEPITNRLDELFSKFDLIDPEPQAGSSQEDINPQEDYPVDRSVTKETLRQSTTPLVAIKDKRGQLGWDDFLNAIDRSEKIGFVYDQNEIVALDGENAGDLNSGVEVPLQIGEEVLQ